MSVIRNYGTICDGCTILLTDSDVHTVTVESSYPNLLAEAISVGHYCHNCWNDRMEIAARILTRFSAPVRKVPPEVKKEQ